MMKKLNEQLFKQLQLLIIKETIQEHPNKSTHLLRDPPNRRHVIAFLMSVLPNIDGAMLFDSVW